MRIKTTKRSGRQVTLLLAKRVLSSVLRFAWIEEDVKYDESETGGGTCTYTAEAWIESEKSVNWKLLVYRIDNAGASSPFCS